MSIGLDQFLASFDQLARAEQEEAAREIWQRLQHREYGPIPEDVMLELADQGFQRLDTEEEQFGKSQAW